MGNDGNGVVPRHKVTQEDIAPSIEDIMAARDKMTDQERKDLDRRVDAEQRKRMSGSREALFNLFGVERCLTK